MSALLVTTVQQCSTRVSKLLSEFISCTVFQNHIIINGAVQVKML